MGLEPQKAKGEGPSARGTSSNELCYWLGTVRKTLRIPMASLRKAVMSPRAMLLTLPLARERVELPREKLEDAGGSCLAGDVAEPDIHGGGIIVPTLHAYLCRWTVDTLQ